MGENKLFSADFKNDEKIIFFSSSIIHSGYYFMDFQQVYALNHSGHSVRMINGGVAGGSAEQGMERIEFDILAQKPDRVFICFGMNDVCYMLYAEENPDADNLAQREKAIADHRFYMEQCIGTLLKNNIKVTVVTTSGYDEYSADLNPLCCRGKMRML